jgi:thioredoxin 2
MHVPSAVCVRLREHERRGTGAIMASLSSSAREEAGRFVVLKIDTEAHPAAGTRFGIQAIPTLTVFRDGKEVERVSGALPISELRRFAATATTNVST